MTLGWNGKLRYFRPIQRKILFINLNAFQEVVSRSLNLCNQLLTGFSNEFSVFTNKLNMCSTLGKRERLAISLLVLNNIFSSNGDVEVASEIKLTRTDLANFIGTSLENLIRMMNYSADLEAARRQGARPP